MVPAFWFVFKGFREVIEQEIKPYLVSSMALAWSRRVCPVVMLLISVLAAGYYGDASAYPSLADAVRAKKGAVAGMTGSALVQEVSRYLAFYEGVKAYSLG